MCRHRLVFDKPEFAGSQTSRAISLDPGSFVRVTALLTGYGIVSVQLRCSFDKTNWSVLGNWQAPGPSWSAFSEVQSKGSWVKIRAETVCGPVADEIALEESECEVKENGSHEP